MTLSCTREVETENTLPASRQLEIRAAWAQDNHSRTALADNGSDILWTPGETINVFYGSRFSGKFTSSNAEPQALVTFSGNLTFVTGSMEQGNESSRYFAVYPYDENNTCDGQSVTLALSSKQTGKPGTFADKFFPAVAVSATPDLAFYNVCGGARFGVTQEGIVKAVFRSHDGSPMAGKVKVGFGDDNKPQILELTDPVDSVVVSAPAGGFIPGENYFAAMLPQAHASGISVTLYTAMQRASKTIGNPITVRRSIFGMLENLDDGLVNWEEYEPEKQILKIPNSIYVGESATPKSSFSDQMFDNPIPAGTEIWINGNVYVIPESREIAVPAAQEYCLGYPAGTVSWADGCVEVDFPSTVSDRSCAFYGYCEQTQLPAEVQLSCLTGFLDIVANSDFAWVRVTVDSDAKLAGHCLYGPMQEYTFGDQGNFPDLFYHSVVLYDIDGDHEVVLAISPQSFNYLKLEFFDQNNQLISTRETSRGWTSTAGAIMSAKVNISQ